MICSVTTDSLDDMDKSTGDRLRRARMAAGYADAAAFADRVGINRITYRAYENGQNGYAKHAALFAQKLGTTVEWLLYGINPPKSVSGASLDPDMLADVEAVTQALLLRLGRKAGEAEVLSRVARRAVEALQAHPSVAGERMGRARGAVDALWTGFRQ
jgi:transcriptional regulator with XRE-family HTH domain